MKKIVEMKFGSHLYGTNTPNSDLDIKGIFIPEYRDIILGKQPKTSVNMNTNKANTKNSKDDVDAEYFPLQKFIELCAQGQTVAYDMLFAPESMLLSSSPEWDYIIQNRDKLVHSKATAFVGYCYQQAAKYGLKGSRIDAIQAVLDILETADPEERMGTLEPEFDKIIDNKLITYLKIDGDETDETYLEVCDKKLGFRDKVKYVLVPLEKYLSNYGVRAKLAQLNQGVDWKALSHAVRVCYQAQELLLTGHITFPLKDRDLVLAIKKGELSYKKVAEIIEHEMEKVKSFEKVSKLPKGIDKEFWDNFIFECYSERK